MKANKILVKWCVGVLMLGAMTTGLAAAVIFDEPCNNLSQWGGWNLSNVTADGQFHINGDAWMETNATFNTPADVVLSFGSLSYSVAYNQGTTPISIGMSTGWSNPNFGLGVSMTTFGEGTSANYYYNGTAYVLDKKPITSAGNIAMTIEYFSSNKRLVITQISGTYLDTDGITWLPASNTVLVDTTFALAYDYATYNRVVLGANPSSGGGGSGVLDNIQLAVVPEPATIALLISGGVVCLLRRRKM
jgi:hypothetical protein